MEATDSAVDCEYHVEYRAMLAGMEGITDKALALEAEVLPGKGE